MKVYTSGQSLESKQRPDSPRLASGCASIVVDKRDILNRFSCKRIHMKVKFGIRTLFISFCYMFQRSCYYSEAVIFRMGVNRI